MNDWLVMLFLAGDNDLLQFGETLLDEVTRVGSSSRVTIVAERDPTDPELETERGALFQGRREMRRIGVTDGTSPQTIIDFVDDSKDRYEALHRALILWDHGNGWQNVHVFDHVVNVIGAVNQRHAGPHPVPDGTPLFVSDLRAVLNEKRNVAIVGFDACLMSMIEVAFQLRDTAQFMVASQHLVPAARGWPYEALLRAMTLEPKMDPEAVVRTMVDTFAGSYNGASDPVTLTGLRLSTEVDRAVAAIDGFSRVLLAAIAHNDQEGPEAGRVRDQIIFARQHTQSFGNPDYIDLVSFCEQVAKRLPTDKILRAVDLLKVAMSRFVVRHTRSSSASIGEANGVSIYFPQTFEKARVAKSYAKLDFADPLYCRWANFLNVIVEGGAVEEQLHIHTAERTSPPLQAAQCGCKETGCTGCACTSRKAS